MADQQFANDVLDVIWLSRNMTDALYRTLRDAENSQWDDLVDAQIVIEAMPTGELRDALWFRIKKAKREA